MGFLDNLFGGQDQGGAGPSAPSPPIPADASLIQRYLLAPMGASPDVSEGFNTALGAIGAGLLTGDRYHMFGPGFQASLEASTKSAEHRRQRAALKMVLKQANPSLPDDQLEAMASDPATAKLALSAAELQAQTAAGQRAAATIGPLIGAGGVSNLGMGSPGVSPNAPGGPAAGASLNGDALAPPTGTGAEIQNKFVGALKDGGLTNPNALGALAAYAQHESRYSPDNIVGSWSDPSQKGQPGTSGGILSWRNERLDNMRAATAGAKDPVIAQAQFTLNENPELTAKLQAAKSPEEANALLADAWRFAGYDKPGGGEYARRLATTQAYANRLGQPPTQVADATGTAPVSPVTRSDLPPVMPNGVSGQNPNRPVQVADDENQTQVLEGRMGMYPRNVYGITPDPARQPAGAPKLADAAADMPAPGAQPAEFRIPPGPGGQGGPAYAPDSTTARAVAVRQANAANPGGAPAASSAIGFPLNDPATAAKAIPALYQVLGTNLPESQRQQYTSLLNHALGVVKPTERTRSLMESGYVPGTPEYVQAYRNLVNADRTPSGYRFKQDGQTLEAIPGGPQDPANKRDKTPPAGYRMTEDGGGLEAIPGGPADPSVITARTAATAAGKPPAAPKPLPHNAVKDLSEAGASYGDFTRLTGGFQPAYAGWKIGAVGDAANQIARTTGIGNTDAADWWADYSAKRNVVRNKLFGAALTSQEKSEFEKADITPGMTSEAITKNLARQTTAATAAARKMAAYYVKAGRSPDEIEAALGVGLDQLGVDMSGGGAASRSGGSTGAPATGNSSPAPSAAPSLAPEARFGQLTATGLSKQEAYARMRQEGY